MPPGNRQRNVPSNPPPGISEEAAAHDRGSSPLNRAGLKGKGGNPNYPQGFLSMMSTRTWLLTGIVKLEEDQFYLKYLNCMQSLSNSQECMRRYEKRRDSGLAVVGATASIVLP